MTSLYDRVADDQIITYFLHHIHVSDITGIKHFFVIANLRCHRTLYGGKQF